MSYYSPLSPPRITWMLVKEMGWKDGLHASRMIQVKAARPFVQELKAKGTYVPHWKRWVRRMFS